jgi:hypothetical protein
LTFPGLFFSPLVLQMSDALANCGGFLSASTSMRRFFPLFFSTMTMLMQRRRTGTRRIRFKRLFRFAITTRTAKQWRQRHSRGYSIMEMRGRNIKMLFRRQKTVNADLALERCVFNYMPCHEDFARHLMTNCSEKQGIFLFCFVHLLQKRYCRYILLKEHGQC